MHIAYLTPEYPHEATGSSGGMGTSIKNLVTAIVQEGHSVSVFVYGQKEGRIFEEDGVVFYLIKQQHYKVGGFYFYRKHIEKYVNNHSKDIDIIEAADWTGITAFMNLKKPLVIRFHGSDTYFCHIEGRKQKAKNAFFERKAVQKAKAYISPTHFAGTESMKLFNQPLSKLQVIHYGLELERFENNTPDSYQSQSLLNIGTLIRKKGVFQLIETFNALIEDFPEATLTFIGADSNDVQSGSDSTWKLMQELMTPKARKNIKYLGKIPYDQIQSHIMKAHVCVFPSLAETLGMVTIESMALRKAVVNTNIGWAQDLIVDGEDGFMHHPDDTNGFVGSISKLFLDKALVTKIGNNARKSVEQKFDIKKNAKLNIDFYNKIITT